MTTTAKRFLDTSQDNEVILSILSYSGGENSISEDHIAQSNEARVVKNWDALSLGGMIRAKGFNRVASEAGATDSDLGHFHYNDTSVAGEVLGIFKGGLYKKNGGDVTLITGGVFTSNELHHAVDGNDDAWITSLTDNLRRYTISGGLVTPSDQPTNGNPRIYRHKNRLIAEGSGKSIEGSRAGTGNWTAADAWSLANDAWSVTLPNPTKGCQPDFPNGQEVLAFTEFKAYSLFNFPNVAFRPIANSRGCSAPYSIARGDEGVYFVSKFPTLGVYIFDGVGFTNITVGNEDVFVDKINFSQRVFGTYRDRKYYLFYNNSDDGNAYMDTLRIFDAKFGRWMQRPINSNVSDTFGIPVVLTKQNNELYSWSSQKQRLYELETSDNSDEGEDTEAVYKTKNFTSRDFDTPGGGQFSIDDVLMKLVKVTATIAGTVGNVTFQWTANEGSPSGSITFDLTADGDLINSTFIVNTSSVVVGSTLPDKVVTRTFNNAAVGRKFNFQLTNTGSSTRAEVKKLKIYAILLGDK